MSILQKPIRHMATLRRTTHHRTMRIHHPTATPHMAIHPTAIHPIGRLTPHTTHPMAMDHHMRELMDTQEIFTAVLQWKRKPLAQANGSYRLDMQPESIT